MNDRVSKGIHSHCRPGASLSAVRDAIRSGADVNEHATSGVAVMGATPLILSSYHNLKEISEVLLAAGAILEETDRSGKTAVMRAVEQGSRETCRLLLQHGACLSPEYRLIYAAQIGDGVEVLGLLEGGVSIHAKDRGVDDVRGGTPVRWAAAFGHRHVVKHLLASDKHELEAALNLALIEGHDDVVNLLEEELRKR